MGAYLHVNRSVNAPPKMGPTMEETPNILDKAARYIARCFRGIAYPRIVMPPENRPAPPAPAMARPTISIGLFLAVAQTMLPTSNMANATTNVHLTSKYVYVLPKEGCREVVHSRYADFVSFVILAVSQKSTITYSVPSDIIQGVEQGCDFGNGSRYNQLVQPDQKGGYT